MNGGKNRRFAWANENRQNMTSLDTLIPSANGIEFVNRNKYRRKKTDFPADIQSTRPNTLHLNTRLSIVAINQNK